MSDLAENRSAMSGNVDRPAARPRAERAPRRGRLLWSALPFAAVLAVTSLLVGFAVFAEQVARTAPPADPHADAIVVLTGGPARIDGAMQLLAQHRAKRLLISGVDPRVTPGDLANLVTGDLSADLACCVDLGREAANTVGNATETRNWAEERGFSSLIVVTSDYHMPRSLTELEGAMPDMKLIPFPVANPDMRRGEWWRDPPTLALLLREYGKYLVAKIRRVLPAAAQPSLQARAHTG